MAKEYENGCEREAYSIFLSLYFQEQDWPLTLEAKTWPKLLGIHLCLGNNIRILIGHCIYLEPVMGRGRSRPLRNLLTRMDEVTRGPMSVLRNCMINKTRVKVHQFFFSFFKYYYN